MLHHVKKSEAKTKLDKNGDIEVFLDGEWLPAYEYTENGVEMIEYDDGICPTCEGEGTQSVLQECGRSSSMCCGGCYEDEECPECEGTGKKECL